MAEANKIEDVDTEDTEGCSIVQLVEDSDGEDQAPSTAGAPENSSDAATVPSVDFFKDPTKEQIEALIPRSIKCDTCGKLFASETTALAHAELRGHSNFSQSTEEVKQLTEEDKKKQVENLRQKLIDAKGKRDEHEKKEAIEKEIRRRAEGKTMVQLAEERRDAALKKAAEEQKRAKRETELEKRRLLELIRLEKEEKKKQAYGHVPQPAAVKAPPPKIETAIERDQTQGPCRIQVRLPNGSLMQGVFKANEPLSAVKAWVELTRTDSAESHFPFALMSPFPRQLYDADDLKKPLSALGMMPSASLVVTRAAE